MAAGLVLGLFIAFTPTIPFQTLPAATAACLWKANLPATVIGVWVTNPLTALPIYLTANRLGRHLLQDSWLLGLVHEVSVPVGRAQGFFNHAVYLWTGSLAMGGLAALWTGQPCTCSGNCFGRESSISMRDTVCRSRRILFALAVVALLQPGCAANRRTQNARHWAAVPASTARFHRENPVRRFLTVSENTFGRTENLHTLALATLGSGAVGAFLDEPARAYFDDHRPLKALRPAIMNSQLKALSIGYPEHPMLRPHVRLPLVGLVGFLRMEKGSHWASDLLPGVLLGEVIGTEVGRLYWGNDGTEGWSPRLWPGGPAVLSDTR